MVPDWSSLLADAIDMISTRLDNDADFVRCRSVCSSWHSSAPKRPLLPWLLIAHGDNSDLGLINFPNAEILSVCLFAVCNYRVFVCQTGPDARLTEVLPACPLFSNGQNFRAGGWSYLVVSSGDLLLATYRCDNYSDVWEVFRIDLDGGQLRLFKMQDLGGGAMFLGSRSMSVYAVNSSWCRANCIYFPGTGFTTDKKLTMVIKVFSMDDNTTSFIDIHPKAFNQYYWLTPNLCR